jgi:hypothetical protein
MTKSRKSGQGKGGEGGGVPGAGAQFYRIAEIHDRLDAEAGRAAPIETLWTTDRVPEPAPAAEVLPPEVRGAWPLRRAPTDYLRPRSGHAAPDLPESAGVMFVTLFDLPPERVAATVRLVERQYAMSRSFRPLFLTDSPDTTAIRHAGFTHEYFPRAVYGAEEAALLFDRRFRTLWRKWRGVRLIDFSPAGYLARRIEDIATFIDPQGAGQDAYNPRRPAPPPPPVPVTDVVALRAEYRSAGLDREPDRFVLYRILGNDLPPRHEAGQTLANLRFMLDHEPELPGCEKRWVVNRIFDPEQEAKVIALLEERGQSYLHIPFVLEDYARVGWDLLGFPDPAFFLRGRYKDMNAYDQSRAQAHLRRLKNNYVINNNGARNAALRDGKGRAKWVLPWDGNCFLTEGAWAEIVAGVRARPYLKYFTVPMSRTLDNADLLDPAFRPEADEEPQLLFRRDSVEEFDARFHYGRRPKVELFYRLAIPGKWDGWPDDVWDLPRAPISPDAGSVGETGWVARLFSGQTKLEADKVTGLRSRGEARTEAITSVLDRLDAEAMSLVYAPENLVQYDEARIAALAEAGPGTPERDLFERLLLEADLALQRGPHSVVDKTSLPPSGDRHDYYHPAPYWWPNPATPSGMPFVFRDGERIPGTRLYEAESDRYDRTRLQRMFDDTTALALAWVATGEDRYAAHAAQLVRAWFLDPETRMNPHLLYAQVRSLGPGDTGAKSGVIEMKDLYYLLDAVRLIERAGALTEADRAAFRAWLGEYLEWLQTSEQGQQERLTQNNHGVCYDLQTASIAAFLGDRALLARTFLTSRERILEQFEADGRQPHEMKRTQTAHYCAFNLQCWVNLATLAEACGQDLWSFEGLDGRGLARAFGWLLPYMAEEVWPHQQIEPFDRGRFLPLFFEARERATAFAGPRLADAAQARPLFFAHDGIRPFWMLGRAPRHRPATEAWGEVSRQLPGLEEAALRLIHGSPDEEEGDVGLLEAKLRAGFTTDAKAALERVRDSGAEDAPRAARVLARRAFEAGNLAEALANAGLMAGQGPLEARERDLLAAACLARLGRAEEAAEAIGALADRFPGDADVTLAAGSIGGDLEAPIDAILRRAGLPAFSAVEHAVGPRSADAPRVSVILTPPPGTAPSAEALRSLLGQTWTALEILLVDRSGGAAPDPDLDAHRRVTVIPLPPDTPEHAARNAALARASGAFVTRHGAEERAHPAKIALQLEAMHAARASMVEHVRVDAEGRGLGGWATGFGFLAPAPASLMIRTDTLRAFGGWDAVPGDPDPFLLWRLERCGADHVPAIVRPGVPLSLSRVGEAEARAPHAGLDDGRARDALRRLEALAAARPEGTPPPPLAAPLRLPPARLDVVFVGDLSAVAPAIDLILPRIGREARDGASVGVFHWPDYHRSWDAPPHEALVAMAEEGTVARVHPFDRVEADRVILCHAKVTEHLLDGLPQFGPSDLWIFAGPELDAAGFLDGHSRRGVSAERIAALFGTTHCRHLPLGG